MTPEPALDRTVTFGRHQGRTWRWVLENDFHYCMWAVDGADCLPRDVQEALRRQIIECSPEFA